VTILKRPIFVESGITLSGSLESGLSLSGGKSDGKPEKELNPCLYLRD